MVVDPLGANPLSAIEIASANRLIFFSRNNPILWLLLEVLASAPIGEDFTAVLNKLMLTRRDGQTLDDHLASLYMTPCMECGRMISVDGYIWDHGSKYPTGKYYHCTYCQDHGERPVQGFDIENLQKLGNLGLHRARAFQRVLRAGDYERSSINNALNCYLPRSLYVIMTLINRLDGMDLTKTERRLLQALLLCVFDDGTSLWHWPEKKHRYLQLSVPSRFFEKNLWKSINTSQELWLIFKHQIPVSYWPKKPGRDGGICLYQRRLAEKHEIFSDEEIAAVTILFPRPNQAFWTLSALWSGWLWGQKAVAPMRSALARRHYNWHWYSQAVHATVSRVVKRSTQPMQAFGIMPQISANHYFGMLTGMHAAGMQLSGAAIKMGEEIAQCSWLRKEENKKLTIDINISAMLVDFFNDIGEPVDFDRICFYVFTEYARAGLMPLEIKEVEDTLFRELQEKISASLVNEKYFQKLIVSSTGGSLWWVIDDREVKLPLSERVEQFVRQSLQNKKYISVNEIKEKIYAEFPGPLIPDEQLIHLCLESYADPHMADQSVFALADGETEEARGKDISEIKLMLKNRGERFGLRVLVDDTRVIWIRESAEVLIQYDIIPTAGLVKVVAGVPDQSAGRKIIVFPGSRSRLIEYRLRKDPRLAETIEKSWQFLKFRYLRWMDRRENLTLESWIDLLGGDPPAWDPPKQLKIF